MDIRGAMLRNETRISYSYQINPSTEVYNLMESWDNMTNRRTAIHAPITDELLPSFVYVCLLVFVGIPGNMLVCAVFHKKWTKKKKPSTLFILTLSWLDLANCLTTLPFEMTYMNFYSFDFPIICKISRWLTYILNATSSVVLIGIAVDRLIGIRYHMKKRPIGLFRAKCFIIAAFVFSVLTCWPSLVLYGTSTVLDAHGNVKKSCQIDDAFLSVTKRVYPFAYIVYLIVSNLIADAIFVVIYSLIGMTVCRQNKENRTSLSRDGDKRRGSSESNTSEEEQRRHSSNRSSTVESQLQHEHLQMLSSCSNSQRTTYEAKSSTLSSIEEDDDDVFNDNQSQSRHIRRKTGSSRHSGKRRTFNRRSFTQRASSVLSSIRSSTRSSTTASISFAGYGQRFGPVYHTRKTTFMLFIVTLVYVLTFGPFCVIAIIRLVDPSRLSFGGFIGRTIYQLFLRSYMLSMAANPVIYSFLNRYFRQECLAIFRHMFEFVKSKIRKNDNASFRHLSQGTSLRANV